MRFGKYLLKHRTRFYLYLSKFLNQKQYWNLVGRILPTDAILDGYFNLTKFFKTGGEVVKFFEKEKLIAKNSVTLHIGCGIGRVEKHLAPKVKKCFGVDISESMINQGRKYVKEENTTFIATDGKSLPFVNNYFNFIYSLLVFQHMPSFMFEKNLKEVSRVLKPQGKFFFQIPIDEKGIKEKPSEKNPWLIRYYKRSQIFSLLKKHGFKVMKTFNGFEKDSKKDLQPNFSFLASKKGKRFF